MYFDAAPEFGSVCSELAIPFQESIPGDPQSNGLIERCNQDALGMTRAALYTSGHPHCFRPYACQAVCFNEGVDHSRGESAWFKMHGREFDGTVLPFGCAVYIKEHGSREQSKRPHEKQRKWDPRGILAVFAGYSLAPGDRFDAYYAWPLEDFVGKDNSGRATGTSPAWPSP